MAFPDSSKKAPNVFLEVFDDTGSFTVKSSGTSYGPIIVNPTPPPPPPPPPAPVVDFIGTPLSGDEPLSVAFTDLSTNSPTSWAWDFENNGSTDSTLQNPIHIYPSAGTYSVKLTASNAGGSGIQIKNGYVVVTAPSLFCSSFVYIFSEFVPLSPSLLLDWPASHLWYFRVYQNPVNNLNLGTATLVTIDASVVLTVADFITSVESQLPGFSVIIDNQNLVLSRSGSVFALEDGDGTEFPTPGYDYGIWDYKAFYEYTDDNSYPDSPFGQILTLGACYPLPPPINIRWFDPPTDPDGILVIGNLPDIEVTF